MIPAYVRFAIYAFAVFCLGLAPAIGAQESSSSGRHWVGTWSASIQEVEEKLLPGNFKKLDDTTMRQVVRVSLGGTKLRVRLSNAFADWNDDLSIDSVTVALSSGDDTIQLETLCPVTFHGRTSVTVPWGTMMVSDPLTFDLPAGSDLAVTMYVAKAPKRISGHRSARGEYIHLLSGDKTKDGSLSDSTSSTCWYYLSGVDVLSSTPNRALICLGDSITDGKGSTEGANRRWPDFLARRLQGANIGVLNQGIGGNALWRGGIGQTALQRLERDVLSQPGAQWAIVFEGVNDLGGGKTKAEELIEALEQIVIRGHECGLRVYGATILPCGDSFYFNPELETKRQAVNEWIRTSGVFDAVIDLDTVLRNPANPTKLLPEADSGDHLHPNDAGHRLIAEAIDINLFTGQ